MAERLAIQIFATTHSWECLVAAHEAFARRSTYDLRVIQLYRLADGTSGRVLDRTHIEAAIAGEIEVRSDAPPEARELYQASSSSRDMTISSLMPRSSNM